MNKTLYIGITILMLLLFSCERSNISYRPSQFPVAEAARNYSFAIPYTEKNNSIMVRIRLNGGPQFEGVWDSGCSVPLKISSLEANSLVKNGTLTASDYRTECPITVANGQTNHYAVYMLKSISFADEEGVEHILTDIPAVIDDNAGTSILIGLPVMQALGGSHEISQYDSFIYYKD